MKTLKNKLFQVVLILMLFTALCVGAKAQTPSIYTAKHHYFFVSTGFDVRNLAVGSKPTNDESELNLLIRSGFRSGHAEFYVGYEYFNRIDFKAWSVGANYVTEIFSENISASAGIEGFRIIRADRGAFGAGINLETKYFIFKSLGCNIQELNKIQISLLLNYKMRNDLKEFADDKLIFRYSGGFSIIKTF